MLKGINVVVGVCGGIAAYKVADVVSRLKKQGAEVNVIMTKKCNIFCCASYISILISKLCCN